MFRRSCGQLKKIYLLIRPKKGKNPRERIKDIFSNVVSDEFLISSTHRLYLIPEKVFVISLLVYNGK